MAQANIKPRQPLGPSLITPLGAVKRFVVADTVGVGKEIGGYRIGTVGRKFRTHFMSVVEEHVPKRELASHTLTGFAMDPLIIETLGGTVQNLGPAKTELAHFFGALALGKQGPGFFDGNVNVCYFVSPVDNKPRAVYWYVDVDKGELFLSATLASPSGIRLPGACIFGG